MGAVEAIGKLHESFEKSVTELAEKFRADVREVVHALGRSIAEVDEALASQADTVMFKGLTRLDFVRFLISRAVHSCEYTNPARCDCKFGWRHDDRGSEQSGCPELHVIAELFAVMGEDDFAYLVSRAQGLERRGLLTKSEEKGLEVLRLTMQATIARRISAAEASAQRFAQEREERARRRADRKLTPKQAPDPRSRRPKKR